MAKFTSDEMLDAPGVVRATCTIQRVCAGQPVSVADAITKTLASRVINAGNYSAGDGVVSGRQSTIDQGTDLPVTSTGTADHVSEDDGATLQLVTTATPLGITSGGTVTVPAYSDEYLDPV